MSKWFCTRGIPAPLAALMWVQLIGAPARADGLFIADDKTRTVYEVTLDGSLISSFHQVNGATSGLDVDPVDGTLWGADDAPPRVANFTASGELISGFDAAVFGAYGSEGVGVDADGSLWVAEDPGGADPGVPAVFHITTDGAVIDVFPTAGFDPASTSPQGLAFDPFDGTLWITDNASSRIYNVSTTGALLSSFPSSNFDAAAQNLQDISVDTSNGTLWLTARDTSRIYNVSTDGALLSSFASTTYDVASFDPTGIAYDASIVEPPSGVEVHVLDEFDAVSFSNQDGTDDWAGDWIEEDVAGPGAAAGTVRISGGALHLDDSPNTGTEPSLARDVDLGGTESAALRFDFATSAGVDVKDALVVEISRDAGASYIPLEVFTGIDGASSGSRSYDISGFATADTRVRFRVNKRYGGSDETFRVEFVEIVAGPAGPPADRIQVLDEFEVESFSNQDGSHDWATDWIEDDAAGAGPAAGNARIRDGALDLDDYTDTGTEPSLAREVDLAGVSAAMLRFDFTTSPGVDTNDAVTLEISSDGGARYTTLEVFTGILGASADSRSYDISGFASANTRVRFRVTAFYGGPDESFRVPYVEITADGAEPEPMKVQVLDEFEVASFSNQDGNDEWATEWIEDDVAGAGPRAGNVQIRGGALDLDDFADTGTEPSVAREVNLAGASRAVLALVFGTTAGVDPHDAVTLEISSDGGASYRPLEVFTGIQGASRGKRSYDISDFASARTRVRFRVSGFYGAAEESFLVEFVEIEAVGDAAPGGFQVLDEFEVVSFANQDGYDLWSGDWLEEDLVGVGPGSGNVLIAGGALELDDNPNSGAQPSLAREVDLSGVSGATLRFDYATTSGVDANDAVLVEISADGGASYSRLEEFTGIVGTSSGSRSYYIGAFASEQTRVRFRVRRRYGSANETFRVEFVEISGETSSR